MNGFTMFHPSKMDGFSRLKMGSPAPQVPRLLPGSSQGHGEPDSNVPGACVFTLVVLQGWDGKWMSTISYSILQHCMAGYDCEIIVNHHEPPTKGAYLSQASPSSKWFCPENLDLWYLLGMKYQGETTSNLTHAAGLLRGVAARNEEL